MFFRCLRPDAGRCLQRSVQRSQWRSASKYQSKSALRLVSYFFGCHLLRSCTGYCPEVLGRVQGTLLSENGWSPRTIVDFSPAFLSFRSVSRRGFAARQPRRQQRGCCPKLRRQSRRYPKRRQLRSCCPRLLRQLGRCCLRHHIAISGDVEKIVTRMTSFYCNHIYEI